MHPDSELHAFLRCLGIERVCQVASCSTYEELRDMGNNCLNLVAAPFADRAAQLLKQREGMEYVNVFVSYDFEEIEKNYQIIIEKLKEVGFIADEAQIARAEAVISKAGKQAEDAVRRAKEAVGEQKLFLDYSAFVRPLKAARFLLAQGFQVAGVYLKDMETDSPDYQWLSENTDIEIVKVNGPDMVTAWKTNGEGVSIGAEAAYVTGSDYAAVMFQDEGMYGYHGVIRLMEMLERALEEKIDLEKTIYQLGLVV